MARTLNKNSDVAIEVGKKIGELKAHTEELKEASFENTIDEEDVEKWGNIFSKVLKSIIRILD